MTETTPTTPFRRMLRRVLRFPLTRLVLALVCVAVGAMAGSIVVDAVATALSLDRGSAGRGALSMVVLLPAVYLAYWIYVRVIERRPLSELAWRGAFGELGVGVLVGAGLFSAVMLAIALTAGLLLAAAFVVTRRLWLVIGIHFAWNFTQGGIFGVAVSGHEVDGLLRSELSGPELIAGGDFGPEASIFAVGLCVPVAVYLLVLGHRRGRFIRPMWKRRTTVQSS